MSVLVLDDTERPPTKENRKKRKKVNIERVLIVSILFFLTVLFNVFMRMEKIEKLTTKERFCFFNLV